MAPVRVYLHHMALVVRDKYLICLYMYKILYLKQFIRPEGLCTEDKTMVKVSNSARCAAVVPFCNVFAAAFTESVAFYK